MSRLSDKSYEYDVFISYSRDDRDWVLNQLVPRLRDAGLKVCIDIEDFRAGTAIIQEIERAILTSHKTLLILTPSYLGSQWTSFERYLIQTQDPNNQSLRFIPLLCELCDMPTSLSSLSYIDFTSTEGLDLAWRQLFRAFGMESGEKELEVSRPSGWFLAHPYGMTPNFTGRVEERRMLSDWLNEDTEHPLLVLRGLGGFGKSALAWHWLLHDVDAKTWPTVVWWSFYEAQASTENFLPKTLKYLQGSYRQNLGVREQISKLIEYLKQPGVLLILDGFERELRAYSSMGAAYQGDTEAIKADAQRNCENPYAEEFIRLICNLPDIQGKVLMSTRLRPLAVEVWGGGIAERLPRRTRRTYKVN